MSPGAADVTTSPMEPSGEHSRWGPFGTDLDANPESCAGSLPGLASRGSCREPPSYLRRSVHRRAGSTVPMSQISGTRSLEQKSDSDAASWLPPNKGFRWYCVARQIAIKTKYRLWVTAPERDAMARVLSTCAGQTVPSWGGGSSPAPPVQHTTTAAAPSAQTQPAPGAGGFLGVLPELRRRPRGRKGTAAARTARLPLRAGPRRRRQRQGMRVGRSPRSS